MVYDPKWFFTLLTLGRKVTQTSSYAYILASCQYSELIPSTLHDRSLTNDCSINEIIMEWLETEYLRHLQL